MEDIFTKVIIYINLKGKKISEYNESILKDIFIEVKKYAQKLADEKLENKDI